MVRDLLWFQSFKIYWVLFHDIVYGLYEKMFYVHLKTMHILGAVFYAFLLGIHIFKWLTA